MNLGAVEWVYAWAFEHDRYLSEIPPKLYIKILRAFIFIQTNRGSVFFMKSLLLHYMLWLSNFCLVSWIDNTTYQVYTPSKISTDCYTSELFSHVYPWILFLCHRSSHQYMFVQKLLTLVSFVSSGSENYMPPRLWGGSCCCYACYHSICIKGGKCFKGTTLFFFFLV